MRQSVRQAASMSPPSISEISFLKIQKILEIVKWILRGEQGSAGGQFKPLDGQQARMSGAGRFSSYRRRKKPGLRSSGRTQGLDFKATLLPIINM